MRIACVICTDLFDEVRSIVSTVCGHVFHEECIYQWLDQSSTCPDCRKRVTFTTVTKLYFSISGKLENSPVNLENEVHDLEAKLRAKDVEIVKIKKEKQEVKDYVRAAEDKSHLLQQEVYKLKDRIIEMRLTNKELKKITNNLDDLEQQNKTLRKNLEHLQNVKAVISGTQKEVEDMLSATTDGPDAVKQMATCCSILKRELENAHGTKQQLRNETALLQKNNGLQRMEIKEMRNQIKQLNEQLQSIEKENLQLAKQNNTKADANEMNSGNGASVFYESPAPERLKRPTPTADDSIIVTPVSQRFSVEPFKKFKINNVSNQGVVSFKQNRRAETSFSSRVMSQLEGGAHQNNDNSIVQLGYDGLGGHGKFISRSKHVVKSKRK